MADKIKTIPLRDPEGKSHAFEQGHAERLLAYPGSVWRELEAEQKPAAAKEQAATSAAPKAGKDK